MVLGDSSPAGCAQSMIEVGPHSWPLAGHDAVHTGVAQAAIGCHLVASQHTVEFGTQALNAAPTGGVVPVGAKFHGDAIELFKSMTQQHALALGVERGALQAFAVPGGADFQAPVGAIDVHVGGHARHAVIGQVDDGKGQHAAAGQQVEPPLHLAGHGGWGGDGGIPKPPQLAVLHRFTECGRMV